MFFEFLLLVRTVSINIVVRMQTTLSHDLHSTMMRIDAAVTSTKVVSINQSSDLDCRKMSLFTSLAFAKAKFPLINDSNCCTYKESSSRRHLPRRTQFVELFFHLATRSSVSAAYEKDELTFPRLLLIVHLW